MPTKVVSSHLCLLPTISIIVYCSVKVNLQKKNFPPTAVMCEHITNVIFICAYFLYIVLLILTVCYPERLILRINELRIRQHIFLFQLHPSNLLSFLAIASTWTGHTNSFINANSEPLCCTISMLLTF
jgi:hypothetical protein